MHVEWSGAKSVVRSTISRHRRSTVVNLMHRAASFFEAAWHNEGADFASNGEHAVVRRLAAADFNLAIDVGANMGKWAHAAAQCWRKCQVHAFEVAPETFRSLEQATRLLSDEARIAVHPFGLSDQSGTQTMYYYPGHHELTSDSRRHDSYEAVPFDATLTTLDSFCRERGIETIDFLKIDVEGAEHRVLKGARGLLEGGKISCLQFEYGAFSIETRFLLKDYFDLLGEQYAIGKIFPDHVAFADYDWRAENFRFSNYLCVSKDRPDLQGLLQG